MDLRVGHILEFRLSRHLVCKDLLFYLFGTDTASIILDLNDDVTALVEGVENDRPDFRFSGRQPITRYFQAMVGGVPDHMC